MPNSAEVVSLVFRNPDAINRFSIGDWDRLVRQSRQASLLARLHDLLRQHGLDGKIPAFARWHFEGASELAECQKKEIFQTVRQLRTLLGRRGFPMVVLKGTAYVSAGLEAGRGRLIDEVDLLVPRERLHEVESVLELNGWHAITQSKPEQRHCRRWRYDPPAHRLLQRTTVINVHDAFLPGIMPVQQDAARIPRGVTEVAGFPGIFMLSAEDRILHVAALLFIDAALRYGLRDLSDIDLLLRQGAAEADFWSRLLARTDELELGRTLFYTLRYTQRFFDTPVPEGVQKRLASAAPNRASLKLADSIFMRMLVPGHHCCNDFFATLWRHAACRRGHWLRRAPRILIPGFFHKVFINP